MAHLISTVLKHGLLSENSEFSLQVSAQLNLVFLTVSRDVQSITPDVHSYSCSSVCLVTFTKIPHVSDTTFP